MGVHSVISCALADQHQLSLIRFQDLPSPFLGATQARTSGPCPLMPQNIPSCQLPPELCLTSESGN